jgi:hypothetical protein
MARAHESSREGPCVPACVLPGLRPDPKLPYEANSFDVITNCVSVDYLTSPIEVCGTGWAWEDTMDRAHIPMHPSASQL